MCTPEFYVISTMLGINQASKARRAAKEGAAKQEKAADAAAIEAGKGPGGAKTRIGGQARKTGRGLLNVSRSSYGE